MNSTIPSTANCAVGASSAEPVLWADQPVAGSAFDKLARPYRWLEYLAFGRALEGCRLDLLPWLGGARRVLTIGEGEGRFVAELVRRREEGDWRAYGFRKPAPKLLQPLGSKMTIKRWDAEEASGGREVYREGQSAVSEEAATQEAEQEALVALLAWFDRDGRW